MGIDGVAALKPLISRLCLSHHWEMRAGGKPIHIDNALMRAHIEAHLDGTGPSLGACPIEPGENTTRVALLDLDSHKGEVPWDQMQAEARQLCMALSLEGFEPVAFRSSGGQGIHIYLLWDTPQDAYTVRTTLKSTLKACSFESGTKGVKHREIEIFPKQDAVPTDGFGNMFILPLARSSVPLNSNMDIAPRESFTAEAWEFSEPLDTIEKIERHPVQQPEKGTGDYEKIRSALEAIPNSAGDDLSYEEWFSVIAAIHHAFGGDATGLSLAHVFSGKSVKYKPDELDHNIWPHLRSDREGGVFTERTIYYIASTRFGWIEPVDETVINDFDVLPGEVAATEQIIPADTRKTRPNFIFIPFREFANRLPPEWIIKGVIPRADLVVIFGESGAGKSFVALDMACAVARGVAWRGRKVQRGRVAYVVAEGQDGFRNRAQAYLNQNNLTDLPIYILSIPPNFMIDDDVPVAQQIDQIGGVDLIILDTFAQVMIGANENSSEDMGKVLSHLKRLHRNTGAVIMPIHHAGKDLSRGMRGWSGLKAAADAEIEISKIGSSRFIKMTKLKDGDVGEAMSFELVPIDIGVDSDGEAITSCVVRHAQTAEGQAKVREPRGVQQKAVWRVINDLCGIGEAKVTSEAVLADAVAQATPPEVGKQDNRRRDADRALKKLIDQNFVTQRDGVITICS